MGNPYLTEWQMHFANQNAREEQLLQHDSKRDFGKVEEILSVRKSLVYKYAHAIPTDAALAAIARFAPIVEIGSGTGYWASLLRKLGVDILCFDKSPPGLAGTMNTFHKDAECWTEVLPGDDSEIDQHRNRTLFLCWPPPHDEMPVRALTRYQGKHFIYVGELPISEDGCVYFRQSVRPMRKGVTIVQDFFNELNRSWDLLMCEILPHWEICIDNLYIFQRRSTA